MLFPIKVTHLTFDMRIGGAEQVIFTLITNATQTQYDNSVFVSDLNF